MQFSEKRNLTRWLIILASFLIVIIILWNTYIFFQIFKEDERNKMELWAKAQSNLLSADLENYDPELNLFILENNKTIPLILTENDNVIGINNIDYLEVRDSLELKKKIKQLERENKPLEMEFSKGKIQYLYYGNSNLINKLKFYPIALLLIIILFIGLIYNFYRATKMAIQNKLWAGMAKETAHQIGTPLSSLIGWLEILKLDNVEPSTITEIEKDIDRLQTITDRFSKIGSEPILEEKDIVEETKNSFEYLKLRTSKHVEFSFSSLEKSIMIPINPILHSWTIENLVKNAIDAMKGKGKLNVSITEDKNKVRIKVSDTGKGIPKNQFTKIFEPGFTTKKRGWGLGLSLTKRIVQEYHKGQIKVISSEIGKGTTIQVSYNKKVL
ncbi:HAMP domain-containing histidine kinase [Flavobacterium jejuense]|uniref:histidine kinase n=1 Tax=Flavobacterium jejuense TaxID=1544455 RepID=A0ABX0IZI6_9FLAO|nr:HAMP domain-containing sensor histidine kinase [Flavobacterium jejuense]NHN27958.1 HAMP domain-containing histidine kinase [Flavobacterium jejuense]